MHSSTLLTFLRSPINRKITTSTVAKMPVQRITMFKVADEADVPQFLEKYQTLAQDQQKVRGDCIEHWNNPQLTRVHPKQDGKPYILSVEAQRPVNDPRTQGFNVLAQTTFSSLEDVKYYDEKCEAHASLKAFAKERVAGPPMVVMWETS